MPLFSMTAVSWLGQPDVDHLRTWAQNVVRELTV